MWTMMIRSCRPCSSFSSINISIGRRMMISTVAALWGNGDFGRLGLTTNTNTNTNNAENSCGWSAVASRWRPAICSAFRESIRSVACGGAHTLFLTESGSVYATGLNDYGQLGISDDKGYSTEPRRVSGLPEEIIQVSAGYHHSSAITVNGELYMWGNNSNGQLGLGKKAASVISAPTKVDCLSKVTIKSAALGSEHSIAITVNGEALSWGAGGSGRLGHGHQRSILGFSMSNSEYIPRLIKKLEGVKVKSIGAGMLHSACTDENGSVFVFGERAVEKLSLGQAKNSTTPSIISELPSSKEVACGGYHTCAITSAGELYTWGSNENGCLGTGCTIVGHFPERVQGPFLKHAVSQGFVTTLTHLKIHLVLKVEVKIGRPVTRMHKVDIASQGDFYRYPVVGSTLQRFVKGMSMHGAGVVQMGRFPKTGIPLVDNWVREMTWTALNLEESTSERA